AFRWTVAIEPQPVGVRRVQEELLRCDGQDDVWISEIERNVSLSASFVRELGRESLVRPEGVAEQKAPPTTLNGRIASEIVGFLWLAPVSHREAPNSFEPVLSASPVSRHVALLSRARLSCRTRSSEPVRLHPQ